MIQGAAKVVNPSLLEAWKSALAAVSAHGEVDYLLVTSFGADWIGTKPERRLLDVAAKSVRAEPPTTVSAMLAPPAISNPALVVEDAIEAGLKTLGRGRRRGLTYSGWKHTYFERLSGAYYDRTMVRRTIGQSYLIEMIKKSIEWNKNYEAVFYIHTNCESDNFRPRGSPCLQYIQFRLHHNNKISLTAVYRSHDFVNKALGNFIGLSDLGKFVATATHRTLSDINVISLNPFVSRKSQANAYRNAV